LGLVATQQGLIHLVELGATLYLAVSHPMAEVAVVRMRLLG
jgi:hypothetical protein